jgi:hypothetical protein
MTKTCTPKIPKNQILLLKITKCLWNQYIASQTPATNIFFASPSSENYDNMNTELTSLATIINNLVNLDTSALVLPGTATAPLANIWSSNANGVIAYYSVNESGNEFSNFVVGSLVLNQGVMNTGNLRPVQVLNNNESASEAYSVTPMLSSNTILAAANTFVTASTVVGRTGCPGVTNTGFVALQLEVDLTYFAFETCGSTLCVDVTCHKN